MPWPVFQYMTDRQLEAIYEYLSAIPCIDTIIPGQPQLRNDCGKPAGGLQQTKTAVKHFGPHR
jgi:hypothetical protein